MAEIKPTAIGGKVTPTLIASLTSFDHVFMYNNVNEKPNVLIKDDRYMSITHL